MITYTATCRLAWSIMEQTLPNSFVFSITVGLIVSFVFSRSQYYSIFKYTYFCFFPYDFRFDAEVFQKQSCAYISKNMLIGPVLIRQLTAKGEWTDIKNHRICGG